MRGLLALVVIVLILAVVGWISFGNKANEATITIDKEKVKQDVERIKESGKELGDQIERAVDDPPAEEPVESQQ
jgi:hypothetical protein